MFAMDDSGRPVVHRSHACFICYRAFNVTRHRRVCTSCGRHCCGACCQLLKSRMQSLGEELKKGVRQMSLHGLVKPKRLVICQECQQELEPAQTTVLGLLSAAAGGRQESEMLLIEGSRARKHPFSLSTVTQKSADTFQKHDTGPSSAVDGADVFDGNTSSMRDSFVVVGEGYSNAAYTWQANPAATSNAFRSTLPLRRSQSDPQMSRRSAVAHLQLQKFQRTTSREFTQKEDPYAKIILRKGPLRKRRASRTLDELEARERLQPLSLQDQSEPAAVFKKLMESRGQTGTEESEQDRCSYGSDPRSAFERICSAPGPYPSPKVDIMLDPNPYCVNTWPQQWSKLRENRQRMDVDAQQHVNHFVRRLASHSLPLRRLKPRHFERAVATLTSLSWDIGSTIRTHARAGGELDACSCVCVQLGPQGDIRESSKAGGVMFWRRLAKAPKFDQVEQPALLLLDSELTEDDHGLVEKLSALEPDLLLASGNVSSVIQKRLETRGTDVLAPVDKVNLEILSKATGSAFLTKRLLQDESLTLTQLQSALGLANKYKVVREICTQPTSPPAGAEDGDTIRSNGISVGNGAAGAQVGKDPTESKTSHRTLNGAQESQQASRRVGTDNGASSAMKTIAAAATAASTSTSTAPGEDPEESRGVKVPQTEAAAMKASKPQQSSNGSQASPTTSSSSASSSSFLIIEGDEVSSGFLVNLRGPSFAVMEACRWVLREGVRCAYSSRLQSAYFSELLLKAAENESDNDNDSEQAKCEQELELDAHKELWLDVSQERARKGVAYVMSHSEEEEEGQLGREALNKQQRISSVSKTFTDLTDVIPVSLRDAEQNPILYSFFASTSLYLSPMRACLGAAGSTVRSVLGKYRERTELHPDPGCVERKEGGAVAAWVCESTIEGSESATEEFGRHLLLEGARAASRSPEAVRASEEQTLMHKLLKLNSGIVLSAYLVGPQGRQCMVPIVRVIHYYGKGDCSLGQFISQQRFDSVKTCQVCKRRYGEHELVFGHGHGKVHITVGDMLSALSSRSSSGRAGESESAAEGEGAATTGGYDSSWFMEDGKILMWTASMGARENSQVYTVMSDEAWHLSFGKFLEDMFYSAGLDLDCTACPHVDDIASSADERLCRFFGYNGVYICCRYSRMEPVGKVVLRPTLWGQSDKRERKLYHDFVRRSQNFLRSTATEICGVFQDKTKAIRKDALISQASKDSAERLMLEVRWWEAQQRRKVDSLSEKQSLSVFDLNAEMRDMYERALRWNEVLMGELQRRLEPPKNDVAEKVPTRRGLPGIFKEPAEKSQSDASSTKTDTTTVNGAGEVAKGEGGPKRDTKKKSRAGEALTVESGKTDAENPRGTQPVTVDPRAPTSAKIAATSPLPRGNESHPLDVDSSKAMLTARQVSTKLEAQSSVDGVAGSSVIMGLLPRPPAPPGTAAAAATDSFQTRERKPQEAADTADRGVESASRNKSAAPTGQGQKPTTYRGGGRGVAVGGHGGVVTVTAVALTGSGPLSGYAGTAFVPAPPGGLDVPSLGVYQTTATSTSPSSISAGVNDAAGILDSLGAYGMLALPKSLLDWHPDLPLGVDDESVLVNDNVPTSILAFTLSSKPFAELLNGLLSTCILNTLHLPLDILGEPFLKDLPDYFSILMTNGKRPIAVTFNSSPSASVTTSYTTRVYFPMQFFALRKIYLGAEHKFVESLCQSKEWSATGGKSGALFLKSSDDRFIAKEIPEMEAHMFMSFAGLYFHYLCIAFRSNLPTMLVKILGLYQITVRVGKEEERSRYIVITENLFYGRHCDRIFDLKGKFEGRFSKDEALGQCSDAALLDGDFIKLMGGLPVTLTQPVYSLIRAAILNDSLFLSMAKVTDYSMLIGFNRARGEIVVGIIDYIHQYDLLKRMEHTGKRLYQEKEQITILKPREYMRRFRKSMRQYFALAPGRGPRLLAAEGAEEQRAEMMAPDVEPLLLDEDGEEIYRKYKDLEFEDLDDSKVCVEIPPSPHPSPEQVTESAENRGRSTIFSSVSE